MWSLHGPPRLGPIHLFVTRILINIGEESFGWETAKEFMIFILFFIFFPSSVRIKLPLNRWRVYYMHTMSRLSAVTGYFRRRRQLRLDCKIAADAKGGSRIPRTISLLAIPSRKGCFKLRVLKSVIVMHILLSLSLL